MAQWKTLIVSKHVPVQQGASLNKFEQKVADNGTQIAFQMAEALGDTEQGELSLLGTPSNPVGTTLSAIFLCCPHSTPVDKTVWHDVTTDQLSEYIELARHAAPDSSTAMICGHDPGIGELLSLLTQRSRPLECGEMVEVSLNIDSWDDFGTFTRGDITWSWKPSTVFD